MDFACLLRMIPIVYIQKSSIKTQPPLTYLCYRSFLKEIRENSFVIVRRFSFIFYSIHMTNFMLYFVDCLSLIHSFQMPQIKQNSLQYLRKYTIDLYFIVRKENKHIVCSHKPPKKLKIFLINNDQYYHNLEIQKRIHIQVCFMNIKFHLHNFRMHYCNHSESISHL